MKNAYRIALIGALTFNASVSLGWGDLGHETVALIAEKNVNEKTRQGILNILGPEALSLAATWPDAVRDDRSFDLFKPFHFVEIPIGYTYKTVPAEEQAEQDGYTVIHQYANVLRDPSVPRSTKMVALRYLIHVVGDVHQPLHVGNGLDMGGNLCDVYGSENSQKTKNASKLHSTWDTSLVEKLSTEMAAKRVPKVRYYSSVQLAEDIIAKNPLTSEQAQKIQSATAFDWFAESQDLRTKFVYPDAPSEQAIVERDRPYCKLVVWENVVDPVTGESKRVSKIVDGKYDATKIPLLTEAFKKRATDLIQVQILKGGLRLAKLLTDIFGESEAGPSAEELLGPLNLKNGTR